MGMTLFDRIMQADNTDLYDIQNSLIDDLATVYTKVHTDRIYGWRELSDEKRDELFNQVYKEMRNTIKRGLYVGGLLLI